VADARTLPAHEDPYVLARLTRGSYGKAQQFLEGGTFDFNSLENTGKSLKDDPAPGAQRSRRACAPMRWQSARSSLPGADIKTGVPLQQARATVASGARTDTRRVPGAADLPAQRSTEYLHASGILSRRGLRGDARGEQGLRAVLPADGRQRARARLGTGLKVKDPVKGIRGSDRKIIDPIESHHQEHLPVRLACRAQPRADGAGRPCRLRAPLGAELLPKAKPGVHGRSR
jgi:hypothetical protein